MSEGSRVREDRHVAHPAPACLSDSSTLTAKINTHILVKEGIFMANTDEELTITYERLATVREDIRKIGDEKKDAIEAQNFERAAKLRDREKGLLAKERELLADLPPEPPIKTLSVTITRETTCLRIGSYTPLPHPKTADFTVAVRIENTTASSWSERVVTCASAEDVHKAEGQAALWLLKVARHAEVRLACRIVLALTFE